MSASWAAWTVETMIASALLMGAVLLLRGPVRRAFGAQMAYALWALPVLRLMLPSLPAEWREAAATPISRAGETITTVLVLPVVNLPPAAATVAPPVAETPVVSPLLLLGGIWLAGATLFVGWHYLAHRRFTRRLLASATLIDQQEGIRVIESDHATGPVAFGVMRRYVAFPRDFAERYDHEEQALALAHELGHHQRGDLVANWIALLVLGAHWFNPLAWRAFRAFRADQELANDARVLSGRSRADRHAYACAIVKAAHGGAVSAACHLHTIEDLKGRLKMLNVSRHSRRRLATGAAAVALMGAVGLGLTVSGTRAAAAITEKVGTTVGVDLHQATPATPPAPPAPVQPVRPAAVFVETPAPAVPAPAAAPVPPAPPAPAFRGDGTHVSTTATVTKDGKMARTVVVTTPGGVMPVNIADYINISSGECGPDKVGKAFVVRKQIGTRAATVICTDRITKAAMAGTMTEADSQNIERQALTAALSGLQASRASLAANQQLTGEARAEALAGIDEALKEVQGNLANVGKDD